MKGCSVCRDLLSDGLSLCVRARQMDSMDRRAAALSVSSDPEAWVDGGQFDKYVANHNADASNYYRPISTRSATIPLWLNDQYDKDLAAWEEKSRTHLMLGCANGS